MKVVDLKDYGNKLFSGSDFEGAASVYSYALEKAKEKNFDDKNLLVAIIGNRAQALLNCR